ncbi:MAG TPA: hypothetical protein VJ300_01750 [Thermoplasmata archaeon]|nr:hypothetical protein [Thermoplasmata archaeon]
MSRPDRQPLPSGAVRPTPREIEAALSAAQDHIDLARTVGANPYEAETVLARARACAARDELAEAFDVAKEAERLAMQGQQDQIRKAMHLRDSQIEKAQAIIALSEPVVQEAEDHGLDVQDARILLRQARDVLSKGEYVTGMIFARNAEEAVARLEPRLVEARRRRGIQKPTEGFCGACQSSRLHFYDNGWGRCLECGGTFRWRGAAGIVETLRRILGT